MDVSLNFMRDHDNLFAMQDVIYCLQMAAYWTQEAAELVARSSETGTEVNHEGEALYPDETPELKGASDILNYLYSGCANLSRDMYVFMSEVPMNQLPQMWLMNGITRLTEAKFSIHITAIHYGKTQGIGGDDLFPNQ